MPVVEDIFPRYMCQFSKFLIYIYRLSLGAVTMFVRLINDQSTTARVLVFNNLCDISQIKSELSNLNKNTFERILIILNVRKDSFSGDTFQSDYGRKGNHYSPLEIDFMMKTVTYFDSKGWTVPKGLKSKIYQMIDTVCDQTGKFVSYPMQGAPAKVHHAHSRGQINPLVIMYVQTNVSNSTQFKHVEIYVV